jgi:hypothetical protein
VFDYMAAARPAILAIDRVIREIVEAARGRIFVPPSDRVALCEDARQLSRDPERVRLMGQSA